MDFELLDFISKKIIGNFWHCIENAEKKIEEA